MNDVFLKITNMSITASWVVFGIIILRLFLKKAPKWICCLLWSIAAVRLVLPFSFESIFSLIPSSKTIDTNVYTSRPYIELGISHIDERINEYIGSRYFEGVTVPDNNTDNILTVLSIVWLIGVALMVVYTLVSCCRIYVKIRERVVFEDNVFMCDHIETPFIFGIIKPGIYIPSAVNEADIKYIIAHEKAHLKRRDHLWKPLGFLLLTVYWFNPVIWVAYILLCRDIEAACDEKVVKELGLQVKKSYCDALIHCSVPKKSIAACPLAFGETGIKQRITGILNYKKPAFWIILIAVLLCILTAVCFLTNPKNNTISDLNIVSFDENVKKITFSYTELKPTSKLFSAIENIEITNQPVSKSQDENRDKTHPVIIQKSQDKTLSVMQTVYLYFNEDFTQVWGDDGVKPTFTYGVVNSEQIKKFYYDNLNDIDGADNASDAVVQSDIQQLKNKYPEFFGLSTDGGLTVYIWQTAENNYKCYLVNKRSNVIYDLNGAFDKGATVREMRIILSYYAVNNSDVSVEPIINPLSNYTYKIDDAYRQKVKELFWNEESVNVISIIHGEEKYIVSGQDADNLIEIITGLNYNKVMCKCLPDYSIEISKDEIYGIKILSEGESYVRYNKKQSDLSENQVNEIKAILNKYVEETPSAKPNRNPNFNAQVLEVKEKYILVKPYENTDEIKSADKISVSLNVISTIPTPNLKVGDNVRIVYNGELAETYPAQILKVFAIYLLSDNGEVIYQTPTN